MEGVGLLFGKFTAMLADDKDQGRMTLLSPPTRKCFSSSMELHNTQREGKIREVTQALNTMCQESAYRKIVN